MSQKSKSNRTQTILKLGLGFAFLVSVMLLNPKSANAEVLLELFTSQGCSSCPRADRLLRSLGNDRNVITISEHVDYWNYLGWDDPFSKKAFTDRQRAYCRKLNPRGVYTPQAVVDGRYQMNGADSRKIYAAISRANKERKERLKLVARNVSNLLKIEVTGDRPLRKNNNESNSLYLFLTQKKLQTKVISGENRNRLLVNYCVARAMKKKSISSDLHRTKTSFEIQLDKAWNPDNLRLVAFVQGDQTLTVKAIGTLDL